MKSLSLPSLLILTFAAGSAAGAEHAVDQKNNKFSMSELVVKVGDSVSFANSDAVKHNLTMVTPDEESQDLGTEPPGKTVRFSVPKPGVYDVRCSIHPGMKMKIKAE
jgi:plastocyanin